ncbi:MAG TPA: RpiB/LacA/LacB family sugar-phosphate isomerase [Tepidisphaeraceae bacterium]|nr:RpiB/LacA/LacB family sugar-phosphate isomerase [Tepidisphaeraceae bacterium]
MIITARQLEDLHRQNGSNGHITLPYRARLTPLALDFIKQRKLILGYSSVAAVTSGNSNETSAPASASPASPSKSGAILYWCDGPCGPAKAAVVAHEKESNLIALPHAADPKQLIEVIRHLAGQVKAGKAVGGILLVQHGAAATVYANRCPSLRAALGSSLEAVEQAVSQVAANVLIIEYPTKTLQQVKNLLSRFAKGSKQAGPQVQQQIQELAVCG